MTANRETHESWIRDYLRPRYPELVTPYLESLDGFDRISKNQKVDSKSLASIILAASSPRSPLANDSIVFLSELVSKFPEIRQSVSHMFESRQWHARFNAIRCLSHDTPRPFVLSLLRQGLQDKSHRVRGLAAYKINQLSIVELIPNLEICLKNENDHEAKAEIEYYLRLIRDGYCIRRESNHMLFIWISIETGIIGHQITLREIPAIIRVILRKRKIKKRAHTAST